MSEVTVISLDIEKNVFQAHGADARGQQLFSRRIPRGQVLRFFEDQPRCLVALEACGTSASRSRCGMSRICCTSGMGASQTKTMT